MPDTSGAIERATGHPWASWLAWLDARGARALPHRAVADLAFARIQELDLTRHHTNGKPFNQGWWAQSIAIAYERAHEARAPGQTHDGTFAASVSRTIPGTLDEALARWCAATAALTSVDGVAFAAAPTTSSSPKWRYWRVPLADGGRVQVDISARPAARGGDPKAVISVQHAKLPSADDIPRWKAAWRAVLATVEPCVP